MKTSKPAHFITIAVDGGAASGKSSTSRALAERHDLMHVDTGAHYRTITVSLLAHLGAGAMPAGGAADAELATRAGGWLATPAAAMETRFEGRAARLAVGGRLLSDALLRTPEVNAIVSRVAAIPAVRAHLYDYQRSQPALAREAGFAGLVMEGRDIGTVILPDADLRIFLEADVAARTARRVAEGGTDLIAQRDKLDASRVIAPLAVAAGAVRIDSTHLSLEQVVEKISGLVGAFFQGQETAELPRD
jgi:cytidylate kinase